MRLDRIAVLFLFALFTEVGIAVTDLTIKTTTPIWRNIELLAKYLNAFPSLKNLSSEDLGFPEGLDFNNPMFQPTTPGRRTVESSSLVTGSTETSTETSLGDLTSTVIKETTVAPTFFSNATLSPSVTTSDLETTVVTNVSESAEFECYQCLTSLPTGDMSCPVQRCSTKRCISAFAYKFDPQISTDATFSSPVLIQQCDTSNIVFEISKIMTFTSTKDKDLNNATNSSSEGFFNFSCNNENVTIKNDTTWRYHSTNMNDSLFIFKYSCCNTSGCNNLTTMEIGKIDDELLKKATDLSQIPTFVKTTQSPDFNLQSSTIYNINFTTGIAENTNTVTEYLNSSVVSSFRTTHYSGSASGEINDTFGRSSSASLGTTGVTKSVTTWHPTSSIVTHQQDSGSGSIPTSYHQGSGSGSIARTSPPYELMNWTTHANGVSGSGLGSGEYETGSGNVQTTPTIYSSSETVNTILPFSKYPDYTSFQPRTHAEYFSHTSASDIQESSESSQMTMSSKNDETTNFSTSGHSTTQPFVITTLNRKIRSTEIFTEQLTTNRKTTMKVEATNSPILSRQNDSLINLSNSTEKVGAIELNEVDENFRIRVLLLIESYVDLTNTTILSKLEYSLLQAYRVAKEKKSTSRRAERLSRRLLSVNESNNYEVDIVLLQRVTDHSVYVEFAVRKNDQYLESSDVVSVLSVLSPEELSEILGTPVLSPVIAASELEVSSAWMITSLTVIPILFLLLILLCCVKFTKREHTNVKRIERRQSKIERYPIYTSREIESRYHGVKERSTKVVGTSTKSQEMEQKTVDIKKLIAPLPTLPEEQLPNLYSSGEFEEINETRIKTIEEEMPNVIYEGTLSVNEENYVNTQTLQKQIFDSQSPFSNQCSTNIVEECPSSYLPRVSPKTTPLVTQPISHNWVSEISESGDGVAELNADLLRIRARMKRMKNAERNRNKRQMRQRITEKQKDKTPSPLPPEIHNPFTSVEKKITKKSFGDIEPPRKLDEENRVDNITKDKHNTPAEIVDTEKQRKKRGKRKRRKLLMTILKDWENRHLRNHGNNVEILSPACKLSLDAKMQRWNQPSVVTGHDWTNDNSEEATKMSPSSNSEIRLVRVISVPLNNNINTLTKSQ